MLEEQPFWKAQPDLPDDLEPVRAAFWALSASRHTGWDEGRIPFEAIDRYAARFEVDDFEEFHMLIRAMDSAYLKHRNQSRAPRG